jgi:2-polyprenyl-6-methoxyphenol hydroxylase-like FAD-dependent oxidoreductase
MSHPVTQSQICAGGCGQIGMMPGYLFRRASIKTIGLERHGKYRRDFRGDTLHPSILRIMDEPALLEAFLHLPLQRTNRK